MPFTVWFTGLPGSGKTTLGRALYAQLQRLGEPVEKLDSDYIPGVIVKPLGTEARDRDIRVRLLAFASYCLNRHGVSCVVAATTPRVKTRMELRELLKDFVEVFVQCPLEVAERRDPKGLYAMARAGLISNFTGVGEVYEEPESPEIVVSTDTESVDEGVDKIFACLFDRGYLIR